MNTEESFHVSPEGELQVTPPTQEENTVASEPLKEDVKQLKEKQKKLKGEIEEIIKSKKQVANMKYQGVPEEAIASDYIVETAKIPLEPKEEALRVLSIKLQQEKKHSFKKTLRTLFPFLNL